MLLCSRHLIFLLEAFTADALIYFQNRVQGHGGSDWIDGLHPVDQILFYPLGTVHVGREQLRVLRVVIRRAAHGAHK